jgi:ABC-type sugar transport system substrate-binding protein
MSFGLSVHTVRRIGAAFGTLLLVLALTACGSSNSSSSSGGGSAASGGGGSSSTSSASSGSSGGKTVHLAIIVADSTENAFQEMSNGGVSAAGHIPGVKLSTAAPAAVNPTQEVQMFQAAQQNSKDGIALMTVTPPAFVRPFSQAVAAGVPVVAVDAPGLPGSNVTTFVGNSNTQIGQGVASAMLAKIPSSASGTVVIGNPIPGLPLLQARINGFIQVIKVKRPNLKVAGPFNVGNEPTDNYNHWNSLLQKYPNGVAYFDPGDQGAISLARIEKATGKKLLVGACDVDPAALQGVKNGYVYALGDPHHFLKGYVAISLLAAHAQQGKALPQGWFNPGFGIVTSANIDQVISREQNNDTRYAFFKPILDKELADPSAYIKPLSQAN